MEGRDTTAVAPTIFIKAKNTEMLEIFPFSSKPFWLPNLS